MLRTTAAAALSAICSILVVSAAGCGTDAVGIEDCREIERARCEAGASCGLVKDVDDCKRFFRDQCLHGLALENEPNRRNVDNCAKSIRAAGECAKAGGGSEALACSGAPALRPGSTLTRACDVVAAPEETADCDFLVPDDKPPAVDSGGADGPTDSAGG